MAGRHAGLVAGAHDADVMKRSQMLVSRTSGGEDLSTLHGKFGTADLTSERVLLFFTSDRVMKTRSGRPKSPLSIDKTRRVVRQALAWAEAAGMVAKAPVPEMIATH